MLLPYVENSVNYLPLKDKFLSNFRNCIFCSFAATLDISTKEEIILSFIVNIHNFIWSINRVLSP